jgi:hypothetical protein
MEMVKLSSSLEYRNLGVTNGRTGKTLNSYRNLMRKALEKEWDTSKTEKEYKDES